MTQLRSDVVNQLVDAATKGMLEFGPKGSSGSEVFSAYLTMTLRAIICAKDLGADMESFRAGIERIYSELPPMSTEHVN